MAADNPSRLGPAEEEAEDESVGPASLQEPKSTQSSRSSTARRILIPFGRSSTLKSGSLQDLKLSSSTGTSQLLRRQAQAQAQAPPQSNQNQVVNTNSSKANQKAKLLRQRSSQASSASSNALNVSAASIQQNQPMSSLRQNRSRNPLNSSKSMLLLAQNQHIPQATAQLDCLMSKQQADFINYAAHQYAANQFQQQHQNDLAWSSTSASHLNSSQHNAGDHSHLSHGSTQSVSHSLTHGQHHLGVSSAGFHLGRANHHHSSSTSTMGANQQVDSSSANALSKHLVWVFESWVDVRACVVCL